MSCLQVATSATVAVFLEREAAAVVYHAQRLPVRRGSGGQLRILSAISAAFGNQKAARTSQVAGGSPFATPRHSLADVQSTKSSLEGKVAKINSAASQILVPYRLDSLVEKGLENFTAEVTTSSLFALTLLSCS